MIVASQRNVDDARLEVGVTYVPERGGLVFGLGETVDRQFEDNPCALALPYFVSWIDSA